MDELDHYHHALCITTFLWHNLKVQEKWRPYIIIAK